LLSVVEKQKSGSSAQRTVHILFDNDLMGGSDDE